MYDNNILNSDNYTCQATTIERLKEALPSIETVVSNLKKESTASLCGPCPKCGGDDRFVYRLDSKRCFCRGCHQESMDVIDFHKWFYGSSLQDLKVQHIGSVDTCQAPPVKKEKARAIEKNIVAKYPYTDEAGEILSYSVRFEEPGKDKTFRQWQYKDGRWIWNVKGVRRVLYNLRDVLKAETVFIPEGEKAAERLREMGLVATTNPNGAGKWLPEYTSFLQGKSVVILPDNDEPGRQHRDTLIGFLRKDVFSLKTIDLPGLPPKGDIVEWSDAGGTADQLQELVKNTPDLLESTKPPVNIPERQITPQEESWNLARTLFPKVSFPWEVLPPELESSLKQLARSCATSSTSLPGASIAIFSSILGATVTVQGKGSWSEPFIFWFQDIRASGDGKTHAARMLMSVIQRAQERAENDYSQIKEEWDALPPKERGAQPARARGYYLTGLTLEGLREELSGHGGLVCILDELSGFINAQNQYKGKGDDREAWLELFDGKPARIGRAAKTKTIKGARVSLSGGIQPQIWRSVFTAEKGLYLDDGTVYRFLCVYEEESFYPLTKESWSIESRASWEIMLNRAMVWADHRISDPHWRALKICLDDEAQDYFIEWRNILFSHKPKLPGPLKGFVPKLITYALRLTGVLHCMAQFAESKEPRETLSLSDVKRGIQAASFYMGHTVNAMSALLSENYTPQVEMTEQVQRLAETLEALRPEVDNGRLAVGYIRERYNLTCNPEEKVSPKTMGSMLKGAGLTVPATRNRANGKAGVYCLKWDKSTDSLIKQVHKVHQVHSDSNGAGLDVLTLEKQSPSKSTGKNPGVDFVDMGTLKSIKETPRQSRLCGHSGLCGL